MSKKSIVRIGILTAAILMIPLVAMIFTNEVKWNVADFIVMGILIFGTGLAIELARMKVADKNHRLLIIIGAILTFLYIWSELSVGILTNLGS